MGTYTILSKVHIRRENVRSSTVLRKISKGIGGMLWSYHSFAEEVLL